jgi:hypothetical protein
VQSLSPCLHHFLALPEEKREISGKDGGADHAPAL